MKNGLILDANDVKQIIAEHFHVPEANVIKSQYSYTVITEDESDTQPCKEGSHGSAKTGSD